MYQRGQHGFIERLSAHLHLSAIKRVQTGGLSPTEIANALNLRGPRALNGRPWDADLVEAVIRRDRRIRLDDALLRAEREKGGRTATVSPFMLHIPHASRTIPPDVRSTFLPDDAAIERELLRMTDAFTDEIVTDLRPVAERVIFPVSRLVVDPERFPDDAAEPMAAKGMGAVYTRLSTGEPLRIADPAERRLLMETYYFPHHARLERAVADALAQHDQCLIIDVHSFASVPLPHEPDQTVQRPEICIGFDAFHSPFRNDADVLRACERMGFVAAVNRPFAGSIVPGRYWNADARVKSFMIEVRRDLYLDEATGAKRADFCGVSKWISALIEDLAQLHGSQELIR